jgi:hypothetical protein
VPLCSIRLNNGIEVRNKLQRAEKSLGKTGGRQRRTSISIFGGGAPGTPGTPGTPAATAQEVDEFKKMEDMMNSQMFDVKQSHIKGGGKNAKMQVGDMGITFYSADMKPLESILYQSMRSWNSRDQKDMTLLVTIDGAEKEVVLKTPDGDKIAQLMKDKASSLAVEHRARRASIDASMEPPPPDVEEGVPPSPTQQLQEEEEEDTHVEDEPEKGIWGVGQTHLEGAPEIVRLAVDDEGVTLSRPDTEGLGAPLSEMPFGALLKVELAGGGAAHSGELCLTCQNGDDELLVTLTSPQAAAICACIRSKQAEAADTGAAAAAAEEEEEEEEDEEEVPKELYTVEQVHFRGSREVQLVVTRAGFELTDTGRVTGSYPYTSMQSWFDKRGESVTLLVEQGNSGLVTDFIFITTEGHQICSLLQSYAADLAAAKVTYKSAEMLAEEAEEAAAAAAATATAAGDGAAAADGAAGAEAEAGSGGVASRELKQKLKMAEMKNSQYRDQIEDLKEGHELEIEEIRNTLREQAQ